jgi:hypothetical protein
VCKINTRNAQIRQGGVMQGQTESMAFVERQVAELVMEVLGRLEREEPDKLRELAEKLKKERESEGVN